MGAILRDSSSFQVSRNAIERVAHLSGNRCVHFSCTEGSLVEDVTRFLRGFASCGVWGILSHAAQLSDQAKRVLISSIDSFQDATICSKNRCNIAGLGTRFQSSSRVFLTVAPSAQNISTYTRHLRSIRVERPCSRIVLKMLFRGAGVDSTVASYLSDKTCAVISQMEMLTFPGTELGEIERLRRVVKTCVEKYLLQSSTSEKKLRSILKRGGTRRSKRRRIKFAKQLYVPYRSLICFILSFCFLSLSLSLSPCCSKTHIHTRTTTSITTGMTNTYSTRLRVHLKYPVTLSPRLSDGNTHFQRQYGLRCPL
jgi:hypothetical protein